MALPDFPWLKDVNGSYEHPALANGAKKVFGKLLRKKKNTSISDVIAQFPKGFARPNLFKVDIARVGDKHELFRINCFQAQIPGQNIATTDRDIGFRAAAYQKVYADIILGFYCSGDLRELKWFQEWIHEIADPITNHIGYYKKYISTINITQMNRKDSGNEKDGTDVATWTLKEAYPKSIDPIQLDYGTTDTIMMMNVTITYRNIMHNWQAFHAPTKDYNSIDERGNWPSAWKDPVTGAATPNPDTGNWSNARQGFAPVDKSPVAK